MGYTTLFDGGVKVFPALNAAEVSYLSQFNEARHWHRPTGPYSLIDPEGHNGDRRLTNTVHPDMPDYYCPWKPTEDGTALVWDGAEKAYGAVEWMNYLIHHFLREEAIASQPLRKGWVRPRMFDLFTFDHTCTGGFHAQGEGMGDVWSLLVRENNVTHASGHVELPRVITVQHGREQAQRIVSALDEAERVAAEREAVLAPAREAVDGLRYDYPQTDVQHMLDVYLSTLIRAGYTVIAPDGKTQVDAPF